MNKPKSIILLSGGLDSTVSAAIAVEKTKVLFALTFDYGQRAARMEIQASSKISKALEIKLKIAKLPFFKEFKKCRLLRFSQLPIINNLSSVWVPNRNALFINVAACFAEYYGAQLIITGFNAEEAQEFPDNTPEFIQAINRSLKLSTLKNVRVTSYVSKYTKKEIYRIGLNIKAPMQHIYSCYLGSKQMCGKCMSCMKLKKAMIY